MVTDEKEVLEKKTDNGLVETEEVQRTLFEKINSTKQAITDVEPLPTGNEVEQQLRGEATGGEEIPPKKDEPLYKTNRAEYARQQRLKKKNQRTRKKNNLNKENDKTEIDEPIDKEPVNPEIIQDRKIDPLTSMLNMVTVGVGEKVFKKNAENCALTDDQMQMLADCKPIGSAERSWLYYFMGFIGAAGTNIINATKKDERKSIFTLKDDGTMVVPDEKDIPEIWKPLIKRLTDSLGKKEDGKQQ